MPAGSTTWPTDSASQAGFGIRNGSNFDYWQSNGHGHGGVTLYGPDGNPLQPSAVALADALANPTTSQIAALLSGYNGTTWDRLRVDANKFLQVTLGTTLAAEDQANGVFNTAPKNNVTLSTNAPAVARAASVTVTAAGAGIRNVVTAISAVVVNTSTAPGGGGNILLYLRDGATGAGTIKQQWTYGVINTVEDTVDVKNRVVFQLVLTGLWWPLSANTATTLEFSSGVGDEFQIVNIVTTTTQ